MADTVRLEAAIKRLPGVLGCVILTQGDGSPAEVQAFTRAGSDRTDVHRAILDEVARSGFEPPRQVFVFELDAESEFGDRESLTRAAEVAEQDARARGATPGPSDPPSDLAVLRRRPPLQKVILTSSSWRSEALVSLGADSIEVVGEAAGEKTPHGLKVLAQATLEACGQLTHTAGFELRGAALVDVFGRQAVLVLVALADGPETLGGALVREGPISEAAVRATLDAINRRLGQEA